MSTQRSLFLQYMAQTSSTPLLLEVEKAEGVWMYGPEGNRYLDLISGIGVSNIGHRHPEVIAAIKEQLDKYLFLMVYGEIVQSPQNTLAATMAKTLPEELHNFYFVNSGSEAIEAALKLAKRATGRTEIISCINAYHGSSSGALSAGGNEVFKRNYRPLLPGFKHIEFGNFEHLKLISCRTAAVLMETVQGEAGIRVPSVEYIQELRRICSYTKTLLILDEIQCGAGRTGKIWAFNNFNIVPDMLVAAKGMGGGMPIGALCTSKALMSHFAENPILGHITTFGGHPVSCVAANATFNLLLEGSILSEVSAKGELFKQLLKHPLIKEVRGIGLMLAAEMEDYPLLKRVIDELILQEVLTDWFLFCDNSMRIAPPLTISFDEIRWVCARIIKVLDGISTKS